MHASVAVRISQKKSLNAAELKHKDAGGEATSKSQRSSEDAVAPMGIATTNAELRLMAAVEGMDKVSSEFQPCDDVSFGGVLLDCNEFTTHAVKLTSGEIAEMQLAERGTLIGSTADERIWVREIRRLTDSGHQVSIVSTEWEATPAEIAGPQFGRWYQENFFK